MVHIAPLEFHRVTGRQAPADRLARGGTRPRCGHTDRALLLRYAIDRCEDVDATRFEAHLLSCDVCFDDLLCLDRVGSLLRELSFADPDAFRSILRPEAQKRR